jgi:hypothetical protein
LAILPYVRAFLVVCLHTIFIGLAACGPSTIRVVGILHQSSEMRPLPAVPLGGYQQLRLLVRPTPGQSAEQFGSPDCGFARLEGTTEGQDLKNAACVPAETLNTAVGIVRQRLRAYGIQVARDASEPRDYVVEVLVTGEAPKKPDRTAARAFARLTLRREAGTAGTLVSSIDWNAASTAFDAVTKNCGLRHADDPSGLSASSTEPMTPDFDLMALASNAVDNLLRCYDLANFFLEARSRFPKTGSPQPAPTL